MIATAARGAVCSGACGVYYFGKGLNKVLSKFGPVLGALGSAIASLLSADATSLLWIENNLWVLLVAIILFLWSKCGREK